MVRVGMSEVRRHLSGYVKRARDGEEVIVTLYGTPVARIVPVAGPRSYDHLVAGGIIEPAPASKRTRPAQRVSTQNPVSELVHDQRR